MEEIRRSFTREYESQFKAQVYQARGQRNDSDSNQPTRRKQEEYRESNGSNQVNDFDLDEQITRARRIIGITNIDDFWKLTPNEFDDLCRGALLAQYDNLTNQRVSNSMVRPVGLIDDIQGQSQQIDTVLSQIKDYAEKFGKESDDSERKQMDVKAFYELVMQRGRE
ncbi:hypothetical protein [Companilactobacillus pabuli]|nr:hypothetical protein [Companilactobacillus pabuli]